MFTEGGDTHVKGEVFIAPHPDLMGGEQWRLLATGARSEFMDPIVVLQSKATLLPHSWWYFRTTQLEESWKKV